MPGCLTAFAVLSIRLLCMSRHPAMPTRRAPVVPEGLVPFEVQTVDPPPWRVYRHGDRFRVHARAHYQRRAGSRRKLPRPRLDAPPAPLVELDLRYRWHLQELVSEGALSTWLREEASRARGGPRAQIRRSFTARACKSAGATAAEAPRPADLLRSTQPSRAATLQPSRRAAEVRL
eukprot:355943-Chlamydomonas_euryale.AAC.4